MQTEECEHGYLAVPDGGGPGIVVVHDVWGLYDHFRDVARRLAGEGFVALSVDLYRAFEERPRTDDPGAFMRRLSDPEALSVIARAVLFLSSQPSVAPRSVGVMGFCMGGSFAWLAAAAVPGVGAAVPFYGILSYEHGLYASELPLDPTKKPRSPLDAAAGVRCPVLAYFGDEDPFIPGADVSELRTRVRGAAFPVDVRVVAGAGHAFMNDTRPAAYRPEASRVAWADMVAFFRRHLENGEHSG